MAIRPSNNENLMRLADQLVWAFATYGVPKGTMAAGTRPSNQETLMSLADQLVWAMSP